MSQHTEIFTLPPFNGQFVPPRYTTDERVGLSTELGSMIFNTTTSKIEYYNGSSWTQL